MWFIWLVFGEVKTRLQFIAHEIKCSSLHISLVCTAVFPRHFLASVPALIVRNKGVAGGSIDLAIFIGIKFR